MISPDILWILAWIPVIIIAGAFYWFIFWWGPSQMVKKNFSDMSTKDYIV